MITFWKNCDCGGEIKDIGSMNGETYQVMGQCVKCKTYILDSYKITYIGRETSQAQPFIERIEDLTPRDQRLIKEGIINDNKI